MGIVKKRKGKTSEVKILNGNKGKRKGRETERKGREREERQKREDNGNT